MNRSPLWIPYFVTVIVLLVLSLYSVSMQAEAGQAALFSPGGYLLMPLSENLRGAVFFERYSYSVPPYDSLLWIYSVSPVVALILIYNLIILYIVFYVYRYRKEKSFIYQAIVLTITLILFIDYGSTHIAGLAFYWGVLAYDAVSLYMLRALLNRKTPGLYLWTWTFGSALLVFTWNPYKEQQIFLFVGAWHALYFLSGLLHLLRDSLPAYRQVSKPALISAYVMHFSVGIPFLLFFSAGFFSLPALLKYNVIWFLPSVFPVLYLVLSVRFGLTTYLLPVSGRMLRFWFFVVFTLFYWFTFGYYLLHFSGKKGSVVENLFAVAVFLLIVEPLRTYLFSYTDNMFEKRRLALGRYIRMLSRHSTTPGDIMGLMDRMARNMTEALSLHWVRYVISADAIPERALTSLSPVVLQSSHPFWNYVKQYQKKNTYSVFYNTNIGVPGDLIRENGAFLMIALKNFPLAILISRKKNNEAILLEDVRFIEAAAKSLETVFLYYTLLLANLQLRRQEKELEMVSKIQRKMIPLTRDYPQLQYSAYFSPQDTVTGDYLDFMRAGHENYFVFLGDVSGHGLRSAYIMAVVRAFLRGSILSSGVELVDAFRQLNSFLSARYGRGNFITLFGINVVFGENGTQLNFINAGHHPAIIYYKNSRRLRQLSDSQHVMGVLRRDYKVKSIVVKEPVRIFMYTDGAFEIFDAAGKMMGRDRLVAIIRESLRYPLQESIAFIRQKIGESVASPVDMDDLSLLGLDIGH